MKIPELTYQVFRDFHAFTRHIAWYEQHVKDMSVIKDDYLS